MIVFPTDLSTLEEGESMVIPKEIAGIPYYLYMLLAPWLGRSGTESWAEASHWSTPALRGLLCGVDSLDITIRLCRREWSFISAPFPRFIPSPPGSTDGLDVIKVQYLVPVLGLHNPHESGFLVGGWFYLCTYVAFLNPILDVSV